MSDEQISSDAHVRKVIGRFLRIGVIGATVIAVILTILHWGSNPRTDAATIRANFVGIAPQVSGHIVGIHVRDNQYVREGDLLFEIDARPYEAVLARARATLALTRKEVDALRKGAAGALAALSRAEAQLNASAAEVTRREMDPVAADAEIARLEAQLRYADDHLRRIEPLLPRQFVTADRVEEARSKRDAAAAALDEARARKRAAVAALASTRAGHMAAREAVEQARNERGRAEDTVGQTGDINARIAAAEAAVRSAELDVGYCRIRAPFSGRVVNLNISPGAFAKAGVEVFTLVDTSTWYVMANFRETQLSRVPAGAPVDIFLQSQPDRHFRGTVIGLGWAVLPENGTSVMGLPEVQRSLEWIRLATRFPIRIKVENPDDSFRIGASAVVTVRSTASQAAR